MTNLITLDNVSLAYGLDHLLDEVKLQITPGERVCLIGRNGAGKSTLLKVIEGVTLPDSGVVSRKPGLRIAKLSQDLPQDVTLTIYDFVAEGLSTLGKLLSEYHHLITNFSEHATASELNKLEKLQHEIDAKNGWDLDQRITNILTRLDLDPDKFVSELSGGWQRRAALAQALVCDPELLLLDEPTNHLDIDAISWLEEYLLSLNIGVLFITHDRALLQRLATRIIELDRGNLTSWPGDYQNFLRRKEEMLHAEAKQNADFDKKLAQEEVWIRQGIKARRTRNEGRVRALEAMRFERERRREIQGAANFDLNQAQKSGALVVEAEHISFAADGKPIIKDFSMRIMRGDRIGLIGPNGIGKTTLLNILLGKLEPDSGMLKLGTKLEVAYFDQLRQTLDPERTVIDNVIQGSEMIEVNGQRRHIISYLNDFLFTPQRARSPVKSLSGGECNRLLLAKLFVQPANLLVLDEPTNDLDIETLELLEELLSEFKGTLLVVSHDREFLDNIVTSTLVFEGNGKVEEYVGGYKDWLVQKKKIAAKQAETAKVTAAPKDSKPKTSNKLSFKEQRELEELPKKIEIAEKELEKLHAEISDASFYQQDHTKVTTTLDNVKKIEDELQKIYKRWEELDSK